MELLNYIINFIYTAQTFILMNIKELFELFLPNILTPFMTIFIYLYIPVLLLSRRLFDRTALELLSFWGLYFYTAVISFVALWSTEDLTLIGDNARSNNFIILFITFSAIYGIMANRGKIFIIRRGFESRNE